MAQIRQSSVFSKRKEPHTVLIARGDQIRHFTFRPWAAALAGSVVAAMFISYLLATSYLVLRDDLLGAASARQARLQQAYEDRISVLRGQVDRITSRQLLDQQLMETKLAELLDRQMLLSERQNRLDPILARVRDGETNLSGGVPLPQARPDLRAEIEEIDGTPTAEQASVASLGLAFGPVRGSLDQTELAADEADRLFAALNQSLREIESEQIDGIEDLAESAFDTAGRIAETLEESGIPLAVENDDAVGGPLVPVDSHHGFDARVRELDAALDRLEAVKEAALALPIHNPAPGQAVSSRYGVRQDPIIGTPAMHSGMDFAAPSGTAVRSTGAGTVLHAGWTSGYGRMVEVKHSHGFTTRYAHMSKIKVKKGQKVATGDLVGLVGSSGRSTGPHLHYEVRRDGKTLDPAILLKTGKKIEALM